MNYIIDAYLEKEANNKEIKDNKETDSKEFQEACEIDVNAAFNQMMDKVKEQQIEIQEKYDVYKYEHLMFYEKDDKLCPSLEKSVKDYFRFYQDVIKEETFTQLMNETTYTRCAWLAQQNRNILIRDSDWEKIYKNIENDSKSFERYYPMVRVDAYSEGIQKLVIAIVLNDEFYEYCINALINN